MFGSSVKQSSAQANGAAGSGYGEFAPSTTINLGSLFPGVDLTDPTQLMSLGFIAFCGWLAWKRFK